MFFAVCTTQTKQLSPSTWRAEAEEEAEEPDEGGTERAQTLWANNAQAAERHVSKNHGAGNDHEEREEPVIRTWRLCCKEGDCDRDGPENNQATID
mmetsp:Transcript_61070/g.162162  ORF Transcript_61070/g.162162 Transcript_61070/m.162162 type:complete len:96 (+) Transcript_61070:2422-2709(+)